jgi:hypothetical protein
MTDNIFAKTTNNDLQNTIQKTKDWATRIPIKTVVRNKLDTYIFIIFDSAIKHREAINKAYLINMEIRTNEFMLFFQLMMATWYSGRVKVINFPLHWPNMSLSLAWFIFIISTTAFAVFIMAFILLTCQRVVHLSFVFVR